MAGQISTSLLLAVPLAPLAGSAIAGLLGTKFLGNVVGRKVSHTATILGVAIALVISVMTLMATLDGFTLNQDLYTWMTVGTLKLAVGFQIDTLTAMMMCVVTSVSLMVHIYTIGYMAEDDGYNRFFSYISLFTFAMLMLVMSNNFLQLFFGWEAVGLVSYLLIGFWYTRPTAIFANMKAFLVNRVGDFGFILGIGLILAAAGTMNYTEVFAQADQLALMTVPGTDCAETYRFRADGTTFVTSAAEVSESVYTVSAQPDKQGFYRLQDRIVKDNGKPDCSGNIMKPGAQVINFIQFHPSRTIFLMCADQTMQTCIGPFRRVRSEEV